MHRSLRVFVPLAIAGLSACSKEAPKTDSSAVAQAGATTATSGGSYDPTTHVATVIASDYAFVAPDSIPAGWTQFHLVNDGPGFHHLTMARLDSGKTAADLMNALKDPTAAPKWAVWVGGAAAIDPKTAATATLNLQPGNYVMFCFVDVPDHTPHMARGMMRPLTVTAAAGASSAPAAHFSIAMTDYAFTVEGATTLSAGKRTIKVVNNGPQDHELQVVRLAPGKTIKDFGAWLAKPEGPPPGSGPGGMATLSKGREGYFDLDLMPGNYAFICFVAGPDGKPHREHGMVKEFAVK